MAETADLSSDPPPFTARERLMKKTIEELTINWGKEVTALHAQLSAAQAEAEQARAKTIKECAKAVQLTKCGYADAAQRFKKRAIENIRALSATTPKGEKQ